MYQAIEKIEELRKSKEQIVKEVYKGNNLNEVYNRQRELGSMAINIYTDAANAIIPVLQNDGVNNVVWSRISLRLNKLSFISVPSAAELREKYKKAVDNPTILDVNEKKPAPGKKMKVRKIKLPAFLLALAAQGIAIPLFLSSTKQIALVKIGSTVNAAFMIIEVVKYFDLIESIKSKFFPSFAKKAEPDYQALYIQAIQEARNDNLKRLNNWFDKLKEVTAEEIDNALNKAGE